MPRLAAATFALLIAMTFGAFFVAQRLKQGPSIVGDIKIDQVFSPNGDGAFDRARIHFRLRKADDVTVDITNTDGTRVRRLVTDDPQISGRQLSFRWDGRTDEGRVAPDGLYRVGIFLRRQARGAVLGRVLRVATHPPPFRVVADPATAETRRGPVLLPRAGGGNVLLRVEGLQSGTVAFEIWRTDDGPPRRVLGFPARLRGFTGRWDGSISGRPAPPGVYAAVARVRDGVGNVALSPPAHPVRRGRRIPGKPGITVRNLAAQGPLTPVAPRAPARFAVDAVGRPYTWAIRRVGTARVLKRGRSRRAALSIRLPSGRSGVYLFEVRAGADRYRLPFPVQAGGRKPVLVVLPALSWQGRNPVDDDGGGLPDTLDDSVSVRAERPFAGDGLPAGFGIDEGPLAAFLDRRGHRYDVTTDLALARGRGPKLEGHRGVVLAGVPRWLPGALERRVGDFARKGGTVLSLGTDALRRTLTLGPELLSDPSAQRPADAFGLRPRPIAHRPFQLLTFGEDRVGLFAETDGLFTGFDALEEIAAPPPPGPLEAAAGEQDGRPVIAAVRIGRGLVIRTGLPQWSSRLSSDADAAAVTERAWTLLSR